jgi:hypothetical protein
MTSRPPPVPEANRSPKGVGDTGNPTGSKIQPAAAPGNTAEQDRQGNIAQNTHHQGYQQDR